MKYSEYSKTLPLAYNIVDKLYYPHGIKSHQDFVDRINRAGDVNRILIKNLSNAQN